MITNVSGWFEVFCDICGFGCHLLGRSTQIAEKQFKEDGGTIQNGKHYCDKDCLQKGLRA